MLTHIWYQGIVATFKRSYVFLYKDQVTVDIEFARCILEYCIPESIRWGSFIVVDLVSYDSQSKAITGILILNLDLP